jgi:putative spermidine/putrescine transport system ATP-binding protein
MSQDTHLQIDGISKRFGTVTALNEINLSVERGSFVCLLGPSGCGKTTLLRIIAGFENASAGRLILDGQDITALPPHKRGFGMVFQSLALFPHMSVAQNIAYGLKLRRASAAEQRDRVEELLNIIELPHIADRPVSALSGGQRQRVAIARALAIRPKLFLLDEPLSALDAKLRDAMQIELRRLQRKFGVTTVLVTHDQTEAMMLADRLVVMKDGQIRQAADPSTVYQNPADDFVADFLGAANMITARVGPAGQAEFLGGSLPMALRQSPGTALKLAARPEHIRLAPMQGAAAGVPQGTVIQSRDLGAAREWLVQAAGTELRIRAGQDDFAGLGTGDAVAILVDPAKVSAFPA